LRATYRFPQLESQDFSPDSSEFLRIRLPQLGTQVVGRKSPLRYAERLRGGFPKGSGPLEGVDTPDRRGRPERV
jgi:hypothetical protein